MDFNKILHAESWAQNVGRVQSRAKSISNILRIKCLKALLFLKFDYAKQKLVKLQI